MYLVLLFISNDLYEVKKEYSEQIQSTLGSRPYCSMGTFGQESNDFGLRFWFPYHLDTFSKGIFDTKTQHTPHLWAYCKTDLESEWGLLRVHCPQSANFVSRSTVNQFCIQRLISNCMVP
uniref:Uncharacterized protein n=1 Tax=Cacopsylla melanoneura TaxID=428564 RepID=A0A8D8YCY7_9HEMI